LAFLFAPFYTTLVPWCDENQTSSYTELAGTDFPFLSALPGRITEGLALYPERLNVYPSSDVKIYGKHNSLRGDRAFAGGPA
jgi:hypothetical protein